MSDLALCLWYDGRAEEAADFYVAVFRDGGKTASRGAAPFAGEARPGRAMAVEVMLAGQALLLLNGGPLFTFTPAASLMIDCVDQAQVDHFWTRLADGGETSRCGWLKDRFGFSWQVVPRALSTMMRSSDAAGRGRAMQAMMGMTKLDIAALEEAYRGA